MNITVLLFFARDVLHSVVSGSESRLPHYGRPAGQLLKRMSPPAKITLQHIKIDLAQPEDYDEVEGGTEPKKPVHLEGKHDWYRGRECVGNIDFVKAGLVPETHDSSHLTRLPQLAS